MIFFYVGINLMRGESHVVWKTFEKETVVNKRKRGINEGKNGRNMEMRKRKSLRGR